ncbi:hypothetical protein HAX54_044678, partial [Datura stramonium]|nr:hypothetical protein [Datura stramonium]
MNHGFPSYLLSKSSNLSKSREKQDRHNDTTSRRLSVVVRSFKSLASLRNFLESM